MPSVQTAQTALLGASLWSCRFQFGAPLEGEGALGNLSSVIFCQGPADTIAKPGWGWFVFLKPNKFVPHTQTALSNPF